MKKLLSENRGCFKAIAFYLLAMSIIAVFGIGLATWREHNPAEYCDLVNSDVLPKVCKLRYPILDKEEIKILKIENEELKEKINSLENRLEDVKDVLQNGKNDNWQPDPIRIEY